MSDGCSGVNMVGQQLKSVDWGELDSLNLQKHTMQCVSAQAVPALPEEPDCKNHVRSARLIGHCSQLDMFDCSVWDHWVENYHPTMQRELGRCLWPPSYFSMWYLSTQRTRELRLNRASFLEHVSMRPAPI